MALVLIAHLAGETVALDADVVGSVVEIERIAPVPRAAPHIAGLAALRSRVLTVIDARAAIASGHVDRTLPTAAFARFYALEFTAADAARILVGRPPRIDLLRLRGLVVSAEVDGDGLGRRAALRRCAVQVFEAAAPLADWLTRHVGGADDHERGGDRGYRSRSRVVSGRSSGRGTRS